MDRQSRLEELIEALIQKTATGKLPSVSEVDDLVFVAFLGGEYRLKLTVVLDHIFLSLHDAEDHELLEIDSYDETIPGAKKLNKLYALA
jgi:hypothetical protein